ncbi:uncharacterized protein LOC128603804 isoform X2 [Ictalurus furcatus]|uniref:uncharacterized protein LOC128603804 isoform X2 n=1 Tax=Ictalurus furcatus TaxID=66913 RepID=UPI0023505341|nr:uncharacterized protein LOC128603804 isoform X2 [Ictalurus furcatus]XP_053474481.1 uncharacterized protein LOC128603804 isoform X2 [Ictalurus furcatus]
MYTVLITGLTRSGLDELQLHDRTMVLFKMRCFGLWMVYWCCLALGNGESLCKSELLLSSNISTELQSDVLLPCNFNPTLLGSDKTADIAVAWSPRNTTIHHLAEITLQGEVMFWDSKGGRIKTFPKLSESGNFSILLQKVQPYDLGLYHCELFNGTGCRIAYQEVHLLGLTTVSQPQKSIITGASVVPVLLCLFIVCVCRKRNKRKYQLEPESSHEHCYTEVMYTLHSTNSHENPSLNVATGMLEGQKQN